MHPARATTASVRYPRECPQIVVLSRIHYSIPLAHGGMQPSEDSVFLPFMSRSGGIRAGKVVAIVAAIAVVVLAGAGVAAVATVRTFLYTAAAPGTGEEVVIDVLPGATLRSVSRTLEGYGLVRNAGILEYYARYRGLQGRLQAGRYVLSREQTPVEMVNRIVSGDAVFDEMTITIPEGWSINDIAVYLEEIGLFPADYFREAVVMQDAYRDFAFLDYLPDDMILDGYLFPDTYRVFPDTTPDRVVRMMLANLDRRVVQPLSREVEASDFSLHEVLTLASIVQKEAADTPEMPDVAGVFVNRLRIGMRLESDATVNYVLGTRRRQPTFADVATLHPYNTYRNPGLPPGPIGNPGVVAIEASLRPADHEYLFFLHKHTYEIVLTRNFTDHLAAKARYLD